MNAAGMESGAAASSSYVPGRPKRQTYRRANTDRIASATAAAAAAASSYAPDPLYDSSSMASLGAAAASTEDPYVSCFGGVGGGTGSYGSGYCD